MRLQIDPVLSLNGCTLPWYVPYFSLGAQVETDPGAGEWTDAVIAVNRYCFARPSPRSPERALTPFPTHDPEFLFSDPWR
jgi:hypothetical protein